MLPFCRLKYLLSFIKLRDFELSSPIVHVSSYHILGSDIYLKKCVTCVVSKHDLGTQKNVKFLYI